LVRKCTGEDKGSIYALKMIHKVKVKKDAHYEHHFKSEREALEILIDGPFLTKMFFAFQTPGHLFIALGQYFHFSIVQNIKALNT